MKLANDNRRKRQQDGTVISGGRMFDPNQHAQKHWEAVGFIDIISNSERRQRERITITTPPSNSPLARLYE
ncbi:unnamed protein product [Gongylonema pulchrum]|uniref:Uncharacterized protein n=1 Tax=Gongylonema pulchrum TaxID=637853 RepID=A0A183E3Q3_9BILA|nr:unnamed protein product [Gongylonema pulchrum]